MASLFVRALVMLLAGWGLIAAWGGDGEAAKASSTLTLVPVKEAATETPGVDLTKLPIGDGRISDTARAGYLWSCNQNYNTNAPGAQRSGDWLDAAAGTFDITKKPVVDGSNTWASSFTVSIEANMRVVRGNGLPNHATGTYPVASTDDAFQYDRNPNTVRENNVLWRLPLNPAVAEAPSCVGGTAGVLLTGGLLFNAVDAGGRDAVAHELQDACQGHPEMQGRYHYHSLTSCIEDGGTGHSALVGYAFDGFGVYGTRGEDGGQLTNAALDECHGHTHAIEWDGKTVVMYHYHATAEYPYTAGCYRGVAVRPGW